jgi:hypothetical protein
MTRQEMIEEFQADREAQAKLGDWWPEANYHDAWGTYPQERLNQLLRTARTTYLEKCEQQLREAQAGTGASGDDRRPNRRGRSSRGWSSGDRSICRTTSPPMHHWMAQELDGMFDTRNAKLNVLGPRGAAKSTLGTLAFPLRAAVEGPGPTGPRWSSATIWKTTDISSRPP